MSLKFKKGDQVLILAGKDKGRKGKIEKVFPKEAKVLVPGVNIFKKHTRAQGEGRPGGIIDTVRPLDVSKVAIICPKCNKPVRVGFQEAGKNKKIRICRKCKGVIS